MNNINKQVAQTKTIVIIVVLITIAGIISIIHNPSLKKQYKIKWERLAAQEASLNTLSIAKKMFNNNFFTKNCINTSGCPFWSSYPKIRLTNKDGTPNKIWWEKNAYKLINSPNNAKFIIIKMPNDLHKIIAFAEDPAGCQAVISVGVTDPN